MTVGEKRRDGEGPARRRRANGLRDRKPKACSAQIALNRCGRSSRLERGYEDRPSFDGAPERGDCLSVQKAANRSTGDGLRRIIQLNYGSAGRLIGYSSALEPSAAATGLPLSVGRPAAQRATSSRGPATTKSIGDRLKGPPPINALGAVIFIDKFRNLEYTILRNNLRATCSSGGRRRVPEGSWP